MTLLRQAFVIFLAGLLATLAIFAGDELKAGKNSLLAALGKAEKQETGLCQAEMIAVNTSDGVLCVDRFEASPGEKCSHAHPMNQQETTENIAWPECKPMSLKGKKPWTNIALHEAANMCARAGKRLPSAQEWYKAGLGTPDPYGTGGVVCNINAIGRTDAEPAGSLPNCVSSAGAYDMVGNVWEWVDETVVEGEFRGRKLPESGFITAVDQAGIPTSVRGDPDPSFGGDYLWIDKTDVRAVFRGGFWGIEDKVGLYAVNATVPTSFTGIGVGFRCVK